MDHGHHDNIPYNALHDTLALEAAVQVAVDLTNQEDTLIIVTADHGHVMAIAGYPDRGDDILGKYLASRNIKSLYGHLDRSQDIHAKQSSEIAQGFHPHISLPSKNSKSGNIPTFKDHNNNNFGNSHNHVKVSILLHV